MDTLFEALLNLTMIGFEKINPELEFSTENFLKLNNWFSKINIQIIIKVFYNAMVNIIFHYLEYLHIFLLKSVQFIIHKF